MKVLVVGGGIAGISTALSLNQIGVDVRLFESAPEFKALGVGINLQPNAVRELMDMGFGRDLEATGVSSSTLSYYNRHGQLIHTEARGRSAGYRWPQYSVHRGELTSLLWRAAVARLGLDNILVGHHLTSFAQDANSVTASFIDRRTDQIVAIEQGDVLVGADGIHSSVRKALYPTEGPPRYSGIRIWRAAMEMDGFLDGSTKIVVGSSKQWFIAYPIGRAAGAEHRLLVNWLATQKAPGNLPPRADWNKEVRKDEFDHLFANWNFPWLDIPRMIADSPAVYEFPQCDRDPIPQWSFGRVTLVGDAAHPMQPIGAQAGSQAILDARVFARAIHAESSVTSALMKYETERLPAMNAVVLANREYGAERILDIVEDRAPNGFHRIEDIIAPEDIIKITESYRQKAGFDLSGLNSASSVLGPEFTKRNA